MTNILRIDSSVRTGIAGKVPHGSQSRKLTELFIQTWSEIDSSIHIKHRDVGKNPPQLIDEEWIVSEFGYAESEEKAQQRLQLSDELIAELKWADLIVLGMPLYNFGPPAHLKAYIDNIVRKDKTYSFDPNREQPYIGLLDQQKPMIILSSRGGHDFDHPNAPFKNHAEPSVKTAFNFIGIQQFHEIAIEYQEYGGELFEQSALDAENLVRKLVLQLHPTINT
ncbi:FMN-dependent NADH-azoreductase [Acinetobacter wuhouensis]|uniref:FMN dependent NADH:quinone oxidoreductase n=1 Tax=Acinetobacter wuhouensis TaxID=1879050 RepID=A0A3G2T2C5_9GAMM|nr:NAD(P)H-dependent oxidoreductase [Acinetobacter wuhouensis]AYO53896.1 flavin reductase [Acinetobacter wuhouensis]